MPTFLNWLLRLVVTNPICMRLVQGGSRRQRHMLIRSGYLAAMIVALLFFMLTTASQLSVRQLAHAGANTFTWISYLQVGLICLLTPVFMAGAIAQEANPRTWDIMLTTPLNSLQVVLGNLFGRLFFVLALLFSTLPLFAVTQYFGGVPGGSIFTSYAIAATSSLLVASIAVTLSVTRTAGRRAVFLFYITVVMYLFVTYAVDLQLREPAGPAATAMLTTVITPLNPFLALEALLQSNRYVPHTITDGGWWLRELWFGRPIAAFCWTCVWLSVALIAFSTLRLRVIGAKVGTVPWYRRLLRLGARGAAERPARHVSHNPISWRESVARGNTLMAILGRWGFVAIGLAVALTIVGLFHTGAWSSMQFRLAVGTSIAAEIVVITLIALNMSATAVSREREDGTLDLILTTPIQPGAYIAGKLRGLIQFLLPMLAVPVASMAVFAVYVVTDGLGHGGTVVSDPDPGGGGTIAVPVVLPMGALALPITLIPFIALCVMIGLHWSIKSKGTIGSVIAAVAVVLAIAGVLSLCGMAAGNGMEVVGAVLSSFSPINLLWATVAPTDAIGETMSGRSPVQTGQISLLVGSLIAGGAYIAFVVAMHANMKRTFMMTVRRLAGVN